MSDKDAVEITSEDVQDIKKFYDDVYHADAGGEITKSDGHLTRLHKKLNVRPGDHVLDVACGAGEWLETCHKKGAKVAGIDLSARAIAVCRQRVPDGIFYDQTAETLPFEDASFDVVTCLGSLEHFIDPLSSLKEMIRVARPDATFCILVPNEDFLTRKLGLFQGTYQVAAKEVVRTLEEWDTLFSSAGLRVDKKWKDLHVISGSWIMRGSPLTWPIRAAQALALPLWPLRWQYQVYNQCSIDRADL